MKKRYILSSLLATASAINMAQQKQPNIILILADDLGYSDIGAYGSEIHTPNLDRLAAEGTRLQEFYNNSISAPTRASLLTGQYQHRAGVGYFANNLGTPAYQGYLNDESLTLAEVLSQGGYNTYLSGKWHVSGHENGQDVSQPWQRGFAHSFNANNGSYFDQGDYVPAGASAEEKAAARRAKRPYYVDGQPLELEPNTYYVTDLISQHAVDFVREQSAEKPFFLYLAYTAPHWPLQALPEDIAKYKGRYDQGWEVLREERIARQKELGILPRNFTPAEADKDLYDWARLSYDRRREWSRKMETYAAMVDRLDQGIGHVLDALHEQKLDDNTLIIFLSDNGAPAEDLVRWFGRALRNSDTVGTAGSFESQSKNWSFLSNAPLRAYKDYVYEGGISTPFIAWFPGRVAAGRIAQGTGHIIDLAPTFYALANVPYPAQNAAGRPTLPLPGRSLLPVLTGGENAVERPEGLGWERAGNRAFRLGKWKLESHWPGYTWELYDLSTDRGETRNVAGRNSLVVNELSQLYFKWAEANGVINFHELEAKEPATMRKFRESKLQPENNQRARF